MKYDWPSSLFLRFPLDMWIAHIHRWYGIVYVYITCKICLDLKVTFDVRLEVKSCSHDPEQWSNTIQIHPVGIEERLTATVFVDCECPCERPESEVNKLRFV